MVQVIIIIISGHICATRYRINTFIMVANLINIVSHWTPPRPAVSSEQLLMLMLLHMWTGTGDCAICQLVECTSARIPTSIRFPPTTGSCIPRE